QPRIEIDADHARPPLDERLRQPAARAADVEHAPAAHLARPGEDSGAVGGDLDGTHSRVVGVQIRHLVVVGERAPAVLAHQPIMQHQTRPRDPSGAGALSVRPRVGTFSEQAWGTPASLDIWSPALIGWSAILSQLARRPPV